MNYFHCTWMDNIKVFSEPNTKKIGFICTKDCFWWVFGKTGIIPCKDCFEIFVRLKTPAPGEYDWRDTYVALVANGKGKVPITEYEN